MEMFSLVFVKCPSLYLVQTVNTGLGLTLMMAVVLSVDRVSSETPLPQVTGLSSNSFRTQYPTCFITPKLFPVQGNHDNQLVISFWQRPYMTIFSEILRRELDTG